MECPRCGNTLSIVIKTDPYGKVISRARICTSKKDRTEEGCGLKYYSEEKIWAVSVFNHTTMKEERIELKDYNERYLDYDLRNSPLPKQRRMFE